MELLGTKGAHVCLLGPAMHVAAHFQTQNLRPEIDPVRAGAVSASAR